MRNINNIFKFSIIFFTILSCFVFIRSIFAEKKKIIEKQPYTEIKVDLKTDINGNNDITDDDNTKEEDNPGKFILLNDDFDIERDITKATDLNIGVNDKADLRLYDDDFYNVYMDFSPVDESGKEINVNIKKGKIKLDKENDNIRVWWKESEQYEFVQDPEEGLFTWDLSIDIEFDKKSREFFDIIKKNLYVEGTNLGSCLLSLKYEDTFPYSPTSFQSTNNEIAKDSIKFTTVDVDLEAKFKKYEEQNQEIDMKELYKIVEEEGEKRIEKYYWILGGMRIHLKVTVNPSDLFTEYKWSTSNDNDDSNDNGEKKARFYSSYDSNATELTGENLKGADLKEIYWEGDPITSLNETVTLTLTSNDVPLVCKWKFKSRELSYKNKMDNGDDVKMLQLFLRMIGISFSTKWGYSKIYKRNLYLEPGYLGDNTDFNKEIDGIFGKATRLAVRRFKVREKKDGTSPQMVDNILQESTKVDNDVLKQIKNHWDDYRYAYEKFPGSQNYSIDNKHADYNSWLTSGANVLAQKYTDNIKTFVKQTTSREKLLNEWILKETGGIGHWGRNISYRITLGGYDEMGSIGFTQIKNYHKYNSKAHVDIKNLNLYHPEDNIKGMPSFSNNSLIPGGGGFDFALGGALVYGKYAYKVKKEYNKNNLFPRIGDIYEDDYKDLLSKGIMAYNRGPNKSFYWESNWPEMLKKNPPPENNTGHGTRTAIKYSLEIQKKAGIPEHAAWTWTVQYIHIGDDGICQSEVIGDDCAILCPGEYYQPGYFCILPGEDGILDSAPNTVDFEDENLKKEAKKDDQIAIRNFDYQEYEDWLINRKSFLTKMKESFGITTDCK